LKFKEKFFSTVPVRDSRPLTACGAKIFNYATLRFCTIIMHIMLGTSVPNLRGRSWVEHTQIHPALKRGTKHFHNTSKSCGIFSELILSWKVQVWTKFSKKQFWKKVESPLSMNFWRISTSKCRGILQKMGVKYTHSPKSPGPFPELPKIPFF
jgi:hypothetical protein